MKRVIGMIAVAVTMAGCVPQTNEDTWAATTETTEAANSNPSSPWSDDESLFLTLMATEYPEVIGRFGNEFLLDYAYTLCDAVDQGTTWSDILGWSAQYGVDVEMISYMSAASVTIFCPENEEKILR